MQVAITQSGGFVGVAIELGTLDTDELDPAEALAVRKLVESLDFFSLPAVVPATATGADFAQYRITVSDGTRRHTVVFHDDGGAFGKDLRDLVALVSAAGGRAKAAGGAT